MSRALAWSLSALLLSSLSSVGCNLESHGEDSGLTVTKLVGPEGGAIELAGGGAVEIPAGALTESTSIKVTKLAMNDLAALPNNLEAAGAPYAFEPHGLTFAQGVQVSVPFDGDESGVRPMKLSDESDLTWATIVGSTRDTRRLTMFTTSFSVIVAARPRTTSLDGAVIPEDAGVVIGGTGGGGTSGDGTGGGGTGGTSATCTGSASDNPNCINEDCPSVTPTTGPRAMKGACCFRQSNADRAALAWNNGELATIEFRQHALRTITQPTSYGNPVIQGSLAGVYEQDWNNTLLRIEGIPSSGSGPVTVTIGAGRSNCDGTYSFFGDGAAPFRDGRSDSTRWSPSVMTGTWDWNSAEKLTIAASDRAPGVRWWPVAKDHGLFGYEQPMQDLSYELAIQGNSGADVAAQDLNCIGGTLSSPSMWNASLAQTVFFPVADLEATQIDSLALTQNYCSFIALGFMRPELCSEVPRTDWNELPFGMCNAGHCYVGQESHPRANCGGSTGNECCDPTGSSTTTPACNAFVFESLAVLAGSEITDAPHTDPTQPFLNCTL